MTLSQKQYESLAKYNDAKWSKKEINLFAQLKKDSINPKDFIELNKKEALNSECTACGGKNNKPDVRYIDKKEWHTIKKDFDLCYEHLFGLIKFEWDKDKLSILSEDETTLIERYKLNARELFNGLIIYKNEKWTEDADGNPEELEIPYAELELYPSLNKEKNTRYYKDEYGVWIEDDKNNEEFHIIDILKNFIKENLGVDHA